MLLPIAPAELSTAWTNTLQNLLDDFSSVLMDSISLSLYGINLHDKSADSYYQPPNDMF